MRGACSSVELQAKPSNVSLLDFTTKLNNTEFGRPRGARKIEFYGVSKSRRG